MSSITNLDSLSIGQNGSDVITISSSNISVVKLSTQLGTATAATSITALPSAKSFYVISTTVAVNLKGITAGVDGQQLELYFKAGGANNMTITASSTSAAAANKIVLMTTAASVVTSAAGYACFRYNATDSRWLLKYLTT